eukprot:759110-Hanusia_phi.AAC.3
MVLQEEYGWVRQKGGVRPEGYGVSQGNGGEMRGEGSDGRGEEAMGRMESEQRDCSMDMRRGDDRRVPRLDSALFEKSGYQHGRYLRDSGSKIMCVKDESVPVTVSMLILVDQETLSMRRAVVESGF